MIRLVLGTAQFGLPYGIANRDGQVTRPVGIAMLRVAAECGIDMLDTAIAYGESETSLGEIGIKNFKLVTKLPAVPDNCNDVAKWVNEQVAGSLSRLNVSSLYGLLLHRPNQLLGAVGKELYQALIGLKEADQVQKVGVSVYSPRELDKLIPQFGLDLVQAPFNIVDRRLVTSGWLKRLKEEGIEVHTRSAFLQGLLLMPQAMIPIQFSSFSEIWRRWHEWLSIRKVTALQACLAFSLAYSAIDRVVVGADSDTQLRQIIDSMKGYLPNDFPDLSCENEDLINPARWTHT